MPEDYPDMIVTQGSILLGLPAAGVRINCPNLP